MKSKVVRYMDRIKVQRLNPHIFSMDDAGESIGYLVVGMEKALVIDTMNGYQDVRAVARTITELPLMVINTHGHGDHIYGDIYFEEVYIHPLDMEVARRHSQMDGFMMMMAERGMHMPPFLPIQHGDVIDLGGLTVEVVHLPGHTKGSILLLLREDRVLFTGDAINTHLWMQLEESSSPQDFLQALDKIMYLKDQADHILHGHYGQFLPISFMERLREGVLQLCRGETGEDTDYTYFGGIARQHLYDGGNASIVYPKSYRVE